MGLSGPSVSDHQHVYTDIVVEKYKPQVEVYLALCDLGYGRTERRERRLQTG